MEDIRALDLDANLVVLSACSTAEGELEPGEGVESLATGCMYAGARHVIASLWSVSDTAAAQTMEAFYAAYLREGLRPAAALRRAKLAIRSSQVSWRLRHAGGLRSADLVRADHPFFWAPFVHLGL